MSEIKVERQMLHAWKLGLFHPKTNEWMEFEAPLPADFASWLHTEPSVDNTRETKIR
jgi:23S rRNA pseudouridine1911/1915/1917 synthase